MANTTWSTTDKTASVNLTGLNLTATATAASAWVRTVDRVVSGKFYWEVRMTTWVNGNTGVGLTNGGSTPTIWNAPGLLAIFNNGTFYISGTAQVSGFTGCTSGATIGFALDADARLIWLRVAPAGNWNNSGTANPATGVGGVSVAAIGGTAIPFYPVAEFSASADSATANFGDSAFSGTVPSGFTSGFTSGLVTVTNAIVTQALLEQWQLPIPAAYVTQVSFEQWQAPIPRLQVTQVGIEEFVLPHPVLQVTQVAVEEWVVTAIPQGEGWLWVLT